MERGLDSISVKIVAPVAVYPDIHSKYASRKLGIVLVKRKGRALNAEANTQPRVAIR
ncbi:MAG: hypothetical protein IMZ64_10395 [Bacteroidetes bacterium]|nr:hypothetical protein [Bacteroidota bacterium]